MLGFVFVQFFYFTFSCDDDVCGRQKRYAFGLEMSENFGGQPLWIDAIAKVIGTNWQLFYKLFGQ